MPPRGFQQNKTGPSAEALARRGGATSQSPTYQTYLAELQRKQAAAQQAALKAHQQKQQAAAHAAARQRAEAQKARDAAAKAARAAGAERRSAAMSQRRMHTVSRADTPESIAEQYKTTPQSVVEGAGVERFRAGQVIPVWEPFEQIGPRPTAATGIADLSQYNEQRREGYQPTISASDQATMAGYDQLAQGLGMNLLNIKRFEEGQEPILNVADLAQAQQEDALRAVDRTPDPWMNYADTIMDTYQQGVDARNELRWKNNQFRAESKYTYDAVSWATQWMEAGDERWKDARPKIAPAFWSQFSDEQQQHMLNQVTALGYRLDENTGEMIPLEIEEEGYGMGGYDYPFGDYGFGGGGGDYEPKGKGGSYGKKRSGGRVRGRAKPLRAGSIAPAHWRI